MLQRIKVSDFGFGKFYMPRRHQGREIEQPAGYWAHNFKEKLRLESLNLGVTRIWSIQSPDLNETPREWGYRGKEKFDDWAQ